MTSITFAGARWYQDNQGTHLDMLVGEPKTAIKFVSEMKSKKYVAEIKEWRENRSLTANAYCWVLIGKLAAALGITTTEVYRSAIREIGDNSETLPVKDEAVEAWCKNWEHGRLGWFCLQLGASKIEGYTLVCCFYGSSVYDTAQMSRLIDGLVQDCKAQGIETMSDDKLAALVEAWDGR
jgi:hypothetical protein